MTVLFFPLNINKGRFFEVKNNFLNYYYTYIIASLGITSLYFGAYTISMMNCYYWQYTYLTIFLTVGKLLVYIDLI